MLKSSQFPVQAVAFSQDFYMLNKACNRGRWVRNRVCAPSRSPRESLALLYSSHPEERGNRNNSKQYIVVLSSSSQRKLKSGCFIVFWGLEPRLKQRTGDEKEEARLYIRILRESMRTAGHTRKAAKATSLSVSLVRTLAKNRHGIACGLTFLR